MIFKKIFFIDKVKGFSEYFYIWFYSIIPCFSIGIILNKFSKSEASKLFSRITFYYSLAVSFGIIILRDSQSYDGAITAHSYLIIHAFILTSLHIIFINSEINKHYESAKSFAISLLVIPFFTYFSSSMQINTFSFIAVV